MPHTISTAAAATPWRPDQHVFDAGEVLPDALILTDTLTVGAIEGDQPVIEVAYIVDDDAQFVAEGHARSRVRLAHAINCEGRDRHRRDAPTVPARTPQVGTRQTAGRHRIP
ncbi:hypothetical protein MYK68_18235 [Gordonia sp. PP30]|uniref:hypothetical protein n=1 Tax=Gordonia sp. PP30 TaxID=2935861 RepID=UPI001FFF9E92|nr:hypothetical protein [Gordonia sp. PP30]UQE74628.1 hypothetical protein MYK68_18235 [Gordonia sp. PP30]